MLDQWFESPLWGGPPTRPGVFQRVLDITRGSRVWASTYLDNIRSMNIKVQEVEVISLYPMSAKGAMVDVATQLKGLGRTSFDFVNCYDLAFDLSAEQYKQLLHQIYRTLEFGGVLQLAEVRPSIRGTGSIQPVTAQEVFRRMFGSAGSQIDETISSIPCMLRDRGFGEVHSSEIHVPVGRWPDTQGFLTHFQVVETNRRSYVECRLFCRGLYGLLNG